MAWLPQQGIDLDFVVDGLSLLFALLITGIGAFIFLFAGEYMKGYRQRGRFILFLVSFMLAMLGLVLADNLVALFVFWELTTITSFLLIGYSHEDASARRSALQGLLVTGAGALAMLAGFVVLGQAAGTFSLREMLAGQHALADHPHYTAVGRPGAARGVHQVGPVPVPLLAAERDGRPDAGLGLPALGDDGQGRRVPARPPDAGPGRNRALDGDADRGGRGDGGVLGVRVAGQDRPEAGAGLHHGHGPRRVRDVPRNAARRGADGPSRGVLAALAFLVAHASTRRPCSWSRGHRGRPPAPAT